MARKKTGRKPAAKRAKARPKRSFGGIGWLAAIAIGIGWLASDGRPVAYVQSALMSEEEDVEAASQERAPRRVATTDRQAALEKAGQFRDYTARALAAPTDRPRAPRAIAAKPPLTPARSLPATREDDVARLIHRAPEPVHVAAVAPSSAPKRPPATLPLTTSALEHTPPMPQALASPAPAYPAGSGERHATRALAVHGTPDPGTERIATIDSGSTVTVLKSEGAWRLVRTAQAQGWVDGRYLAGEQARVEASPHLATMPALAASSRRERPIAGSRFPSAPVPPLAIATE